MASIFGAGTSQAKQWFEYYITVRYCLCYGGVDEVKQIVANDKNLIPSSTTYNVKNTNDLLVNIGSYDLFGSRDMEGGFKTDTFIRDGRKNQTIDTYFINQGITTAEDEPAYRGVTTVTFRDAYIGNQASLTNLEFIVKRTQRHTDYSEMWYVAKADINGDMNPAHIIYEILVKDYALNLGTSVIDTDTFTETADKLFDEGLGLSYYWTKVEPCWDFIQQILKTIDGYLYFDDYTQKFKLSLLREETSTTGIYEISTTNGNFKQILKRSKTELEDITTAVEVEYTDYSKDSGTNGVYVDDLALQDRLGRINKQKFSFLGVNNYDLALELASRELEKASRKKETLEIECTIHADQLSIGDLCLFTYSDFNYNKKVFRVLAKEKQDFIFSKKVKLTLIEDIWLNVNIVDSGYTGQTTTDIPLVDCPSRVDNITYYQLASAIGDDEASAKDGSDVAFSMQSIPLEKYTRYKPNYDNEDSLVSNDFGAGFSISQSISATDTLIIYDDVYNQSVIKIDTYAYINDEIVLIAGVDYTNKTITIERGLLDTYPQEHVLGGYLFATQNNYYINSDYNLADTVITKFLPLANGFALDKSLATPHTIALDNRYYKPYPPKNIKIDNKDILTETITVTDSFVVSFSSRNRLLETGTTFLNYYDSEIELETFAKNKVVAKFYNGATLVGTIAKETQLNSVTFSNDDIYDELSVSGVTLNVELTVSSIRESIESYQSITTNFDLELSSAGSTDGLILHYTFDNISGNTIIDEMGNYNGTSSNTPVTTTGAVGNAMVFNRSNSNVTGNIPIAYDKMSISFWFKGADSNSAQIFFEFSENANTIVDGGMFLYVESNDVYIGKTINWSNYFVKRFGLLPIFDGDFHLLTFVYDNSFVDGNAIKLYVDAVEVAGIMDTGAKRTSNISGNKTHAGNFYIGSRAGSKLFFNGQIDDFRIYDRAIL